MGPGERNEPELERASKRASERATVRASVSVNLNERTGELASELVSVRLCDLASDHVRVRASEGEKERGQASLDPAISCQCRGPGPARVMPPVAVPPPHRTEPLPPGIAPAAAQCIMQKHGSWRFGIHSQRLGPALRREEDSRWAWPLHAVHPLFDGRTTGLLRERRPVSLVSMIQPRTLRVTPADEPDAMRT